MTGTLLGRTLMWGKFVIFLAAAGLVIYWVRFSPLEVAGHRVLRDEIRSEVLGTGTLEARLQTIVSSKIPGRIFEMLVDEGDEVKEGQVLLRLDDVEIKQQVEIARSSVEAATASVERVQAEAVSAKAVLEQSKSDHRRNQRLLVSKVHFRSRNGQDRKRTGGGGGECRKIQSRRHRVGCSSVAQKNPAGGGKKLQTGVKRSCQAPGGGKEGC